MITKNKKSSLNMFRKMGIVLVVVIVSLLFACKSSRMSTPSTMTKTALNQTMTENNSDEIILFGTPEESPMFNDKRGIEEFANYIISKTIYPEEAWKNNISGRVFVEVTIDVDGSLTDAKVIRSVHPLLDAEALRVVNSSPQWTPAKNRGKSVKAKLTFPFNFTIPVEQNVQ